jgi:hypothetical protein
VENFYITHVKPPNWLEKSKNLELNPRKIWFYYFWIKKSRIKIHSGEDVVSFKNLRSEIIPNRTTFGFLVTEYLCSFDAILN